MSNRNRESVFLNPGEGRRAQKEIQEKIARKEISYPELAYIKLGQVTDNIPIISYKSGMGESSYPLSERTSIKDFFEQYSFNLIVRGIIFDCDKYLYKFKRGRCEIPEYNSYPHFCCGCLESLLTSVRFIDDMLSCKIYLKGIYMDDCDNLYQQLEFARKKITKLKLYILQKYDMMFILESKRELTPEVEKLITGLELRRNGQIGYKEQQTLLEELDDIEAIQYLNCCTFESFMKDPKISLLTPAFGFYNQFYDNYVTLNDANEDQDLWYKIFFRKSEKSSVTGNETKGYYMWEIFNSPDEIWSVFTKNPNDLFSLSEEKRVIKCINNLRFLSRQSEITEDEFRQIKVQLIEKILDNYTKEDMQVFVSELSIEAIKSDYSEREKIKKEINDLNFAIAFVMSYIMKKSDLSDDEINDYLGRQDKAYIENIIAESRLMDALNTKREICNESKLSEEEYQHIVNEVFDEYVNNFVNSKGRHKG